MRKFLILLPAAALICFAACNKDPIPGFDHGENGPMVELTLTAGIVGAADVTTKAALDTTVCMDDKVIRLDLFEYDYYVDTLVCHKRWEDSDGIDLTQWSHRTYSAYNRTRKILLLANFDHSVTDYLATLPATDIGDRKKAIFPISEGNCILHAPLMGGAESYSFTKAGSANIEMYRYESKIEFETITADFTDESYFNKDIKVKSIAIINVPNVIHPVAREAKRFYGGVQDVLDVGYTSFGSNYGFGYIHEGDLGCNNIVGNNWVDFTTTFSLADYGGTGVLANSYPYVLADNRYKDAGVMSLDDLPADMLARSYAQIPEGEGVLCSSTNPDISHTYRLNQQLYVMPLKRNSYCNLYGDWDSQDNCQKLVFEVEIDGETHFYIASLRAVRANTCFKVRNVNLKAPGSPYCNKCTTWPATKASAEEEPFTMEIDVL